MNQETLRGWGVRQSDWQWGITLQQEVLPRVSAEVAYNRRWFMGVKVTDNTLRGRRGLRGVHDHRRRRIRVCPAAAATRSRC